jgi:hypothetical protein
MVKYYQKNAYASPAIKLTNSSAMSLSRIDHMQT